MKIAGNTSKTYEFWYISDAADNAIRDVMAVDHRRTWHPCSDSPSLSTLQGSAKRSAQRYRDSRDKAFRLAGVVAWYVYAGKGGRLVGLLCCADEPIDACGAPVELLDAIESKWNPPRVECAGKGAYVDYWLGPAEHR